MSDDTSIVEYYSENSGYRCGYCKSPNTNYSNGMWAHSLTVQDYQDLIDRGWRRSGCYCYKPIMHITCCPMYTIKCSVLDFKLSKSQKKKMKRTHNFLAYGKKSSLGLVGDKTSESASDLDSGDDMNTDLGGNDIPDLKQKAEKAQLNFQSTIIKSVDCTFNSFLTNERKPEESVTSADEKEAATTSKPVDDKSLKSSPLKKCTRPGDGVDTSRPLCKKAKLLRKERREKKLAQLSSSENYLEKKKTTPVSKSLEDFIHETLTESPEHRLEIRLVRSSPPSKEFNSTMNASLEVYQRYQTTIHNDSMEKLSEKQFTRFLVNSPLKPWKPKNGPPQGYGSFHQQYWLDDRLIAVGVIDILPYCISSVYFFYDPEFLFLGLGTYGSLREIALTRSLHHCAPDLRYYYMGFYIHTCPKMRYKGAYTPSYLLCPETYTWHPIEYCISLLEKNKYCRFNKSPEAVDQDQVTAVGDVSVLFLNRIMCYQSYLSLKQSTSHNEEVTEYAGLVGNKLSKRMLLVLM